MNGTVTIGDVRLDSHQAVAQAELLLAAELGVVELLVIP